MGGKALKNTYTRRYEKAEYEVLAHEVLTQLQQDFPERKIAAIPAYRSKTSFGDLDILFDTNHLNNDLSEYIKAQFKPNELVRNTNVYSFDYQAFQIDIIGCPQENFDISLHYFSWNDLGNILGRVYHKMGFKYGYAGLHLILKDNNHQYADICVSKDIDRILAFAEYDSQRFHDGFNDLEEIFQFAASSPFFNKAIYLLENRNHASRIRDKKRPTYTSLLKWLKSKDDLPTYPWATMRDQCGTQLDEVFLQRAFSHFPELQPIYETIQAQHERNKTIHEKFNGRLIAEWSGLQEKDLGNFMQSLKVKGQEHFGNFAEWLLQSDLNHIETWVKQQLRL